MGQQRLLFTALCSSLLLIHHVHGFDLTILHTNDVHSQVEQFSKYGSKCSPSDAAADKCFGGVARRMTKVSEFRAGSGNVVFLDGGDQFLGTLWFNLYKGAATSHFMTQLGYDAMCIGNHEFDLGDAALRAFLDNVTFPVVSANTRVTSGSTLDGAYSSSATLTVAGEKIGVVGYITPETKLISKPSADVSFGAIVPAVTAEVGRLTGQGVNKIIALGHAGHSTDLDVAKIPGVDVVVGGHTNTFLYNGPPPANDDPSGPYPVVVDQPGGRQALVVQDYTWGKYLGVLNVTFDDQGTLTAWAGNPVVLDGTIPEDPAMKATVDAWGQSVRELSLKVVGSTKVFLNGHRDSCRLGECNMANLFLDSLVDYFLSFPHVNTSWAPAAIAVWNAGGIRASIEKGPVTIADLAAVLPFNNEVDLLVVTGSTLRRMLEYSVTDMDPQEPGGRFLHFSGLRVTFDSRRAMSSRVISVEVRCLECDVPSYSPLLDTAEYKILTNTFLAAGGDGYDITRIDQIRFNTAEMKVFQTYFERHSPVFSTLDGRLTFVNPDDETSASLARHAPWALLVTAVAATILLI